MELSKFKEVVKVAFTFPVLSTIVFTIFIVGTLLFQNGIESTYPAGLLKGGLIIGTGVSTVLATSLLACLLKVGIKKINL